MGAESDWMPEDNIINIGIIGCGGLPQGVLLPCVAAIPELNLIATCDLDEARAEMVARRYGAGIWTTDWRELLEMDELDGVMVVAPPAVHEEVGIAVLERGLHLFIEKPPSMTAEGARRVFEASRGRNLKTLVGTVQRHTPVCRMAKEITQRDDFGRTLLYQARYCAPGPGMRMDWGMDRDSEDEMLHFFLLDHIIHHIDLTRFFMGEIIAVSTYRTEGIPDRYAFAASLKFESGASGSLSCSFKAPSFDNQVVIYGDGPVAVEVKNWSTLEYRAENLPVGKGGYQDSPKVKWDGGISYQDGVMRPGYRSELSLWVNGILQGARCHADVEDAWRDMVVLETLLESLRVEEPRRVEYRQ